MPYYSGPTQSEIDKIFENEDDVEFGWWLDSAYDEGFEDGQSDVMGLDGIANDWIMDGEFDESVEDRAITLGYEKRPKVNAKAEDLLQDIHSAAHPDGPWGYEFCAKCS